MNGKDSEDHQPAGVDTDAGAGLERAAQSVNRAFAAMREEFCIPGAESLELERQRMALAKKVEWGASLEIGVASVDEQHKELLALINRLLDHPGADIHTDAVTGLLSMLGRLLAAHFDAEEAVMRAGGMSGDDIEAHKLAHEQILDEYVSVNLDAADGRNFTAEELHRIASRWLLDHVASHDQRLQELVPVLVG